MHRPPPGAGTAAAAPRERFLHLDRYRVEREWRRYEGTPQRELFRELRGRFLRRHARPSGWSADVGCGPGRFFSDLSVGSARLVGLDLSAEMLRSAAGRAVPPAPQLVRADAARSPLRPDSVETLVLLGNVAGLGAAPAREILATAARAVRPGGVLVAELAPGDGERSRYLTRLPPGAVRRLLSAPVNLVRARLDREGFQRLPRPSAGANFERLAPSELHRQLEASGFRLRETLAVASALGGDPVRIAAVAADRPAWARLLELEEAVGREPARWPRASAVLVALERRAPGDPPAEAMG